MAGFRPNNTAFLGTRPRHLLDESAFTMQGTPGGEDTPSARQLVIRTTPQSANPSAKRARLEVAVVNEPRPSYSESGGILEEMVKHGNKINEMRKENDQLQQQVQALEAELKSNEREKQQLSNELEQVKTLIHVQAGSTERSANQLSSSLRSCVERNGQLQAELKDAKARSNNLDEQLTQMKLENSQLRQQLNTNMKQQLQQQQDARKELANQTQSATDISTNLQRQLRAAQQDLSAEHARNRELQTQCDTALENSRKLSAANAKLQLEFAKLEGDLTREKANTIVETYHVAMEGLRDELREVQQQLTEALVYKEQAMKYRVAQEEVRIAQQRCEHLTGKAEEAEAKAAQVVEVRGRLAAWQKAGQELGINSPEEISTLVDTLQSEKEMVIQQAENIRTELRRMQQTSIREPVGGNIPSQEVDTLKEELKGAKESVMNAERKARVLREERDGLRRLLATYQGDDKGDDQQGKHELVGRLAKMQDEADDMRATLEEANKQQQESRKQMQAMTSERDALQEQKVALEKELDRYMEENERLMARVGRGEFDASNTKVLHFKYNPEAKLRETEVQKLRAQVAALQQQLESVAGGTASDGGVQLAEKIAEIVLLQRNVAATEKQMARLRDVFNMQLSTIKEVCCALFGYRINMVFQSTALKQPATATTTITLQPHLASESNAILKFVYSKQGGMQLVPTSFSQQQQQQADMYIRRFKSIPAFTANLTLENFQKATIS